MGALLSQISGSLGKALMSTFFPVVLFLSAFCVGVLPLYPDGLEIFRPFETLDAGWKVIAFSFCALLLTGVLYNLNTLVTRYFEGYPWRFSALGKLFTKCQIERFRRLAGSRARMALAVREGAGDAATHK